MSSNRESEKEIIGVGFICDLITFWLFDILLLQPHLLGQSTSVKTSLESPENTPPPTPTPPASAGQQHLGKTPSGALGNGGIGQDSTKSKQRKRKKSTAACGMEAQSDAIQPSHIREAIRRYGHKIGPLSPFTVRNNRVIKSYIYNLKEL
uniref:Uncharacterized protein n=1 Tax=Cyanistes caeruleus TaxID=156563 RepID=A0A8C0U1A9_CYACU